jgi:biotin operon repressor
MKNKSNSDNSSDTSIEDMMKRLKEQGAELRNCMDDVKKNLRMLTDIVSENSDPPISAEEIAEVLETAELGSDKDGAATEETAPVPAVEPQFTPEDLGLQSEDSDEVTEVSIKEDTNKEVQ